jgi:hypothetical protein
MPCNRILGLFRGVCPAALTDQGFQRFGLLRLSRALAVACLAFGIGGACCSSIALLFSSLSLS